MAIPNLDELNLLHSNICQAVGDPKRIQILYALNEGPCHVSGLAERLDMPQPTVSRHLGILRQRGLVKTEREGTMITYSLPDERLIQVLDQMRELLRTILDQQSEKMSDSK